MKIFRDIRLIPVVLIAVAALAVLKITGLVLDGGYVLSGGSEPRPRSWAQDNLGYPSRAADAAGDITGSVPAPKKDANPPGVSTERPVEAPGSTPQTAPPPATERAVLERLQERRQEIDGRAREIEIREGLLKATEKRLENKVEELKGVEARISAAAQQKDEADAARFKGLVTMYENMKPKDAAKIFDRLEMGILIEIASRIKPAKMSDVLAQMSAEAAERLTVELARRSGADKASASMDLPKIEGRPAPRN
jgi:flagellar motility protein MotE (MotC chaperone)